MVSTALASEMTNVIRDLGTGVETQGRALGTSVRHLVLAAGGGESSRARLARDIQLPTTHVLGLVAGALRVSASLLEADARGAKTRRAMGDVTIVDKRLTRC